MVFKGATVEYQCCMKRTSDYISCSALTAIFVAGLLCSSTEAKSEPIKLPGDFELGSSLDEAQQHASSRGWQLVRLPPELPDQWTVEGNTGAKIGLFLCDDTVASIHQYKPGDLDEFANIVFGLRILRGKPNTQIMTFMAGATRISNIDVRFAELDGLNVNVQLSSTAGRLGISTNYLREGQCQKP